MTLFSRNGQNQNCHHSRSGTTVTYSYAWTTEYNTLNPVLNLLTGKYLATESPVPKSPLFRQYRCLFLLLLSRLFKDIHLVDICISRLAFLDVTLLKRFINLCRYFTNIHYFLKTTYDYVDTRSLFYPRH